MKRSISFIIAVICALLIPAAIALETEPLSLTIIINYGDVPLGGISLAVCRIADIYEDCGEIGYAVTDEFAGANPDFADLTLAKNIALAASLNAYASANNIMRTSKATNGAGGAKFDNLSMGLYLVVQTDVEQSEYIIAPFIVAVPGTFEGTNWQSVIAYPKTEPVRKTPGIKTPEPTPTPIYTPTPTPRTPLPTAPGSSTPGPKRPGPGSPKTGDAGNRELWLLLMALGGAGILIALIIANSKRKVRVYKRK